MNKLIICGHLFNLCHLRAMWDAIETWAADEFRSTNGQILYILDQALRKAGRLKKSKRPKQEE